MGTAATVMEAFWAAPSGLICRSLPPGAPVDALSATADASNHFEQDAAGYACMTMKNRPTTTFRGAVIQGSRPANVPASVAPVPPAQQKVRVGREVAGRGGKGVTVVSGLVLPANELEALAGELKRGCGAGGGVRSGKIEIQGEHRDRLVDELVRRGYPARRAGG